MISGDAKIQKIVPFLMSNSQCKHTASLCVIKTNTMNACRRPEIQLDTLLTLAIDGGELLDSRSSLFISRDKKQLSTAYEDYMDLRQSICLLLTRTEIWP
jgi:hypothetical protein